MNPLSKPFLTLVFSALFLAGSQAFPSHQHSHLVSPLLKHRSIPEDLEQNEKYNATNDFKTFYYSQTIDHFSYTPESYKKFKQRYVINSKYWGGSKTNSPIFAYLGAEASIDQDLSGVGFLSQYAPQFKALIVFIEHRFYGESNLDGSLTSTLENKKHRGYFDSAQALADYAEIILNLKNRLKAELSPVIVFGGSYGGMLAAWFRLKYPHVALGALASSAPILMNIKSPYTYTSLVNKDFKETSATCHDTIKQSWAAIDRLAATKPNGLSVLTKKFKLCRRLKSSSDVANLKELLAATYKRTAQYDAPPGYPVSKMCKAIDGAPKGADIVDKIFAGFEESAPIDPQTNCYQLPGDDESKSGEADDSGFGWFWQTCTELLNPTDGVKNNSMFEPEVWPSTKSSKPCMDIEAHARFNWVETYYGGKHIKLVLQKFASNIIFYNGLRDPYSGYSVLESLSDTLLAINVPKGSHCLDLLRASRTDPKWLVMARDKEVGIIKDWIRKYYNDLAALI